MEPAVLLMVAMAAFDEVQVTEAVRILVVLSVYLPVAINCCAVPGVILGFAGVTSMDASVGCVAEVTMTQALGERLPEGSGQSPV